MGEGPTTDVPAWASAPVDIQPPDPRWQERGQILSDELTRLLGGWLTSPVEHIGSTAVPGLAAKPVLDVQAGIRDLDDTSAIAAALAGHGWHLVPPELDRRPWRRLLVQAAGPVRLAHLHLLLSGSESWARQRAFRDALRADPALRDRYSTLKRGLARRFADDREAYTAGKTRFVAAVLDPSADG